ncbi:hypothetical protein IscW_ISCW015105 [Ixodes scapularis]|uniref:Uncharacterized protein n=1 Tax=Ixodes scapularis TaxID=6945 RepID=B7QNK4_IXOSC|nr:hypothetical protein IscW_ISCW015105 [Ixodes scapularis]|eukprot:XP_002416509.1 hypothetical protein IscW_ISCW015105 [Ixodes scapularis]
MVPSGDCPDVAFRLKTDAQRSIYRQGFQMCRSPGLAPPHFSLVTVALLLGHKHNLFS